MDYPADGLSVGEDVEMTAVPRWWFDAGRWRRNGSKKRGEMWKIYGKTDAFGVNTNYCKLYLLPGTL